jgi:hypothetical protein
LATATTLRSGRKGLHQKTREKKTYHKFVNTTPKPNATKNKSGELVGPLDGLFPPVKVGVGDGDGEAMVKVKVTRVTKSQRRTDSEERKV